MALNLHKECKDKIKRRLKKHLPSIKITNKQYIKRESTAGFLIASNALPKHGPVFEKLNSYIGEWPLYDFLYGLLSKELNDEQVYDSSQPLLSITDIEGYTDIEATTTRLVEAFDSLPWQYKFTIDIKSSLMPFFSDPITNYDFTDSIRITKADNLLIDEHPSQPVEEGVPGDQLRLALLGRYVPHKWDIETTYLQFTTDGFVGKYVSTETTETILSKLKAFCGLSIALRLLKVEHTYPPATPKMYFIIHKNISGKWVLDDRVNINDDLSRAINDLVLNDLAGELDTDAKKSAWIGSRLVVVK